ncbi:hypothetical protein I541_1900 [Mycobacteroides abscessus]|nr:hypothetical protein I541_1900 [Mycobacteroides abscessus]
MPTRAHDLGHLHHGLVTDAAALGEHRTVDTLGLGLLRRRRI